MLRDMSVLTLSLFLLIDITLPLLDDLLGQV